MATCYFSRDPSVSEEMSMHCHRINIAEKQRHQNTPRQSQLPQFCFKYVFPLEIITIQKNAHITGVQLNEFSQTEHTCFTCAQIKKKKPEYELPPEAPFSHPRGNQDPNSNTID